jgi:hypothetical protein
MLDWRVTNARLSVFVVPDTIVPPTLWKDLVGEEPESSTVQRTMSTKVETGPFAEGKLRLIVQPMRIDWVHEPADIETEWGVENVLGPFPSACEPLLHLGRRWAKSDLFPSIQRIALGLVLIFPTRDRATGYRGLDQFIDGVPNAPDAADFLYQVNRPRPSRAGIDGLRVNRLSKWSVGAYKTVVINPAVNPNPMLSKLRHHVRLELDLNTDADFPGTIARQNVESVIDDLFSGAKEIATHGNHLQ